MRKGGVGRGRDEGRDEEGWGEGGRVEWEKGRVNDKKERF